MQCDESVGPKQKHEEALGELHRSESNNRDAVSQWVPMPIRRAPLCAQKLQSKSSQSEA